MLKPQQVRYRVTDEFFGLERGAIINALLIVRDEDEERGLLYHPRTRSECPSFEIAIERDDGLWESADSEGYVNVTSDSKDLETALFGKRFKWKRVYE